MDETARIFLAVELPKTGLATLAGFREAHAGLDVRWTIEENLHLTVLFIGDVFARQLPLMAVDAQAVAAEFSAEPIHLRTLDWAPARDPARMIWCAGDAGPGWQTFVDDVAGALNIATSQKGGRWRPHVTVARCEPAQRKLLPEIRTPVNIQWTPKELLLVESTLRRGAPPVYKVINEFPFK
jgi:2'-5' RNA ligase